MTKKTPFLLSLSLAAGIGLLACGGAGSDNTSNASNASNAGGNTNKAATTNTAPANTSSTTASTSGDKIGVPECDDFLAKYEACVSGKVPAAAQSAFKTSMETWRKSWKDLAANPATKGSLAAACKQSADQAKTSLASYNCSW
jgi:hypothetical protein